jgi:hypothetical protein
MTCGEDGFCHADPAEAACDFELTVTTNGTGGGLVEGPNGLSCPGTCAVRLPKGSYSLKPTADDDARVSRWTLDGDGQRCVGDRPCVFDLVADTTVDVTFNVARRLQIDFQGDGAGIISAAPFDLNCKTSPCMASFDAGSAITLSQARDPDIPNNQSQFAGWHGNYVDSDGTVTSPIGCFIEPDCTFALDEDARFVVEFQAIRLSVTPFPNIGEIDLSVNNVPAGTCTTGKPCVRLFAPNNVPIGGYLITLDARAIKADLAFWVGRCDAEPVSNQCAFSMFSDADVVGLFRPRFTLSVTVDPGEAVNIFAADKFVQKCESALGATKVTCSNDFPTATKIDLFPAFAGFQSWIGCPTGNADNPCSFDLGNDVEIEPTNQPPPIGP